MRLQIEAQAIIIEELLRGRNEASCSQLVIVRGDCLDKLLTSTFRQDDVNKLNEMLVYDHRLGIISNFEEVLAEVVPM